MYMGMDSLVLNKMDLLPYIPFRLEFFLAGVDTLNPGVKQFHVSCRTGEGMENWYSWLRDQIRGKQE
jgi:hydrogenase nickel incorporation protein HypB